MFSLCLVRGKRFHDVDLSNDAHTVFIRSGILGEEETEVRKTFETRELAEKYAKRTVSNKTEIGFISIGQVPRNAGVQTRASSLKRALEEAAIAVSVSKKLRRSKRLSGGYFTYTKNDRCGAVDPKCSINGTMVSLDSVGACDVMLAQVDTSAGVDNFIVLQLIQEKGRNDSFVLFKRWGVKGQVGSTSEKWFRGLAEAVLAFCEQFRRNTGMDWQTSDHAKPMESTSSSSETADSGRRALASRNDEWCFLCVDGEETEWYPFDPYLLQSNDSSARFFTSYCY